MKKYIRLSVIIIFCYSNSFAQQDTTIKLMAANIHPNTMAIPVKKQCALVKKTLLPASLILSGAMLSNSLSEKSMQRDIRDKVGNDYHNGADDYIQYIPYAQVFIGDAIGLQAKNHWFDQTKNMAICAITTTLVIHSLKIGVGKERPDGSAHNSFPSGHTATAFTGAGILFQEYKDSSPIYAYSGFLFSTATGSLRVMNNRHWMGDVIAGAGIGILVANMVYYIHPLKNWNPFKDSKNISFCPMINGDEVTFTATLSF